jgi:hypothetical protein
MAIKLAKRPEVPPPLFVATVVASTEPHPPLFVETLRSFRGDRLSRLALDGPNDKAARDGVAA